MSEQIHINLDLPQRIYLCIRSLLKGRAKHSPTTGDEHFTVVNLLLSRRSVGSAGDWRQASRNWDSQISYAKRQMHKKCKPVVQIFDCVESLDPMQVDIKKLFDITHLIEQIFSSDTPCNLIEARYTENQFSKGDQLVSDVNLRPLFSAESLTQGPAMLLDTFDSEGLDVDIEKIVQSFPEFGSAMRDEVLHAFTQLDIETVG